MRFFSTKKTSFIDNHTLLFSKQDCVFSLLLAFFILLLPLFSLSSHTRLTLAAAVLLFAYIGIRRRGALFKDSVGFRLYLLFFATVFSGVCKGAARETVLFSVLMLSGLLPYLYPHFKEAFFRALAISGGAFGGMAILERTLGRALALWSDEERFGVLLRVGGPFKNPNLLGVFLALSAVFALDCFLSTLKRGGWSVYALSLSLSLSGLLLTFSRGAWLGACFGLCFYLWQTTLKKGERLFSFAPLFLPVLQRVLSVFSPDSSMAYRFSLWKSIFSLPISSLLFGVGEGKGALLSLLSPVMAAGLEKIEHTHSLYLHILVAEGLLGLILFLALAFYRFKNNKSPAVRAALLSLLFYGIFDDPLYSGQIGVLLWSLINVN